LPSRSAIAYKNQSSSAFALGRYVLDEKFAASLPNSKQIPLHASLAAHVAAWEYYIENIALEFLDVTSNPLDQKFHLFHELLRKNCEEKLKHFNTPNAENSRELLIAISGFDTWQYWIWRRRNKNALETRELLNQVLKVRHSFAHGFQMPKFDWNSSSMGRCRLSTNSLELVGALFKFLVRTTDAAMANHLKENHQVEVSW
jgi:hypothetical protein